MTGSARRSPRDETHIAARRDLPAYTLRLSDRTRHVRLTMTPRDGLVVVVPRRMRGFDPSAVLRDRRDWIADASARIAERRAVFLAGAEALLPETVWFPATGERWGVDYRHSAADSVSARVNGDLLVVQGTIDDADACLAALTRWLQRAASDRLLPRLAEESARAGLTYERGRVRGQRQRWGSCSARGSISLNRSLVFLAPDLATAVIRHELAHMRQHNHSQAFWRELARLDPRWAAHRKTLAHAWDAVPPWAEP